MSDQYSQTPANTKPKHGWTIALLSPTVFLTLVAVFIGGTLFGDKYRPGWADSISSTLPRQASFIPSFNTPTQKDQSRIALGTTGTQGMTATPGISPGNPPNLASNTVNRRASVGKRFAWRTPACRGSVHRHNGKNYRAC